MSGEVLRVGPFRPEAGSPPPHLAGRECEQSFFRACVAELAQGVPAPSEVIVLGPYGYGRRSLLTWLEEHVRATRGVDLVRVVSSEVGTLARLAERLLPGGSSGRRVPEEARSPRTVGSTESRPLPPSASEVFARRAARRPLVLLLDEAEALDLRVGNAVLNAGQEVGSRLPFLLVLAGTPDIVDRLGRMEASFWHRIERMHLGRLDASAAAQAIERPLADAGMAITPEALDRIVEQARGYPPFLQSWGDLVWRRAAGGRRDTITDVEVEESAPGFERTRRDCYRRRCRELEGRGLLPVAQAVAEAFGAESAASASAVDRAIRGVPEHDGHRAAADAKTVLKHLGVLWRPGPTPDWEPGIPGVMDYLRRRVAVS